MGEQQVFTIRAVFCVTEEKASWGLFWGLSHSSASKEDHWAYPDSTYFYKHRSFQQINLIYRSFPACKKMWCIGLHLWMEVTGWVTSGLARSTWIPSIISQNWLCGAWNPWRKEQQTLDIYDACRAVFTCSTKLGKQACQKKDDLNQSHILQVMLQVVLQEMMSGENHQNRASMKTQEKANQSLTPAH